MIVEAEIPRKLAKPSYASYLAKFLADDEIAIAQQLLTNKLLNKTVDWVSTAATIIH